MANQWFRMYSEFAGDPVIQSLAFEDQRHYVVLLCLKNDGVLDRDIPATRRELIICRGLGLDPATAAEVKRRLMEVNLIDKSWQILGWNKRQFVSDNVSERTRKHRNKNKTWNVPETLQERSGNAPEQNRTEQNRTEKTKQIYVPSPQTGEADPPLQALKNNGVPFLDIVALYHDSLPELPACVKLTETRRGYIRQRWQEDLPDLGAWGRYFEIVKKSDFLMGRLPGTSGKPPFRADLEWLTKASNIVKVIEGKYHRGQSH